MQAVFSAFIANPVLTLATGVAAGALLVLLVQGVRARTREPANPLEGLFQSEEFNEGTGEIAEPRGYTRRRASGRGGAVLRARVDHLPLVGQLWGHETREAAIAQVAQVMRASVREEDAVCASAKDTGDEGTIEIQTDNVSEAEAGAIARRLLDTLSHMPVPGMGSHMRVSASFGVAARLPGESQEDMRARAEVALAAAQAAGEDRVVTSSEWEEIKLLPAPTPSTPEESTGDSPEGSKAA